jgi:hypothetical protein
MNEVPCDEGILSFDGRVLEYFGYNGETPSIRYHVRCLVMELHAPSGGADGEVWLTIGRRGGYRLSVPSEHWPGVQGLLARVHAVQVGA